MADSFAKQKKLQRCKATMPTKVNKRKNNIMKINFKNFQPREVEL